MITLKNWINKCILKIPLIGEINDRFIYLPPKLADSYFGKTTKFGGVLEIFISKKKQWPINVGKIVKDVIFSSYPTLVFNVCFSCSRPSFWKRIGNYANPKSIWFNVFFGFYEINAPLSGWDRPFGFIANNSNQLAIEDLIKLAKADWNFFFKLYVWCSFSKLCYCF